MALNIFGVVHPAKADGASLIMDYIRNNQSEFDGLTRFEFRYNDEIGNRADVLVGEVNYEMKSWVKGGQTWNDFFKGAASSNSYQQFLSYLGNTDNLTNLKYVFNRAKASESDVKSAFRDLFHGKAEDIYFSNPSLFNQYDRVSGGKVESFMDFTELLNHSSFDTEHTIFDFIKL